MKADCIEVASIRQQGSEFKYLLNLVALEILLKDDLDIVVIG
jgi:hypothetical protein